MYEHTNNTNQDSVISVRAMDIITALLFLAVGLTIMVGSIKLGASWGVDGPEAGYFPFYISLIIMLSSAVTLYQAAVVNKKKKTETFVDACWCNARCNHRCVARLGWCKWNCDSVAIDFHNAANFRDHYAFLYYWGALFGGAITSVLFNIPGEPWSVATTFDGYPMARNGKAGEALLLHSRLHLWALSLRNRDDDFLGAIG